MVVRLSMQLDEPVVMELRDTDTFWLLDWQARASRWTRRRADRRRAERGVRGAARRAATWPARSASSAQTFNDDTKQKEVQMAPLPVAEMGTQATIWDIWDAQNGSETGDRRPTLGPADARGAAA